MSPTQEAAMKMALEALEHDNPAGRAATITALKAALAEPVQEPVAIADGTFNHDCPIGTLLYAAPPQRSATV